MTTSKQPDTPESDNNIKAYAIFPNHRRVEWMRGNRSYWNGEYYETPIPRYNLAQALDIMPHHDSALEAKHNMLMTTMDVVNDELLSEETLSRACYDYLLYGDLFMFAHTNRLGGLHHYEHLPSLHTRRAKKHAIVLDHDEPQNQRYALDKTLHIIRYDGRQEMYGRPSYMAALLSVYLGEAATRFRYFYIKNRSNTGFLLYLSGEVNEDVVDEIEDALAGGEDEQFGNVVIHDPNGGENKIKLIPISDKTNEDSFSEVKEKAMEDVLVAHRVPPQLLGIIPKNTGGFGSAADAARIFNRNEVNPLHLKMKQINKHAGRELISFKPYEIEGLDDKKPGKSS